MINCKKEKTLDGQTSKELLSEGSYMHVYMLLNSREQNLCQWWVSLEGGFGLTEIHILTSVGVRSCTAGGQAEVPAEVEGKWIV